jgi:hypothetical protein
MQSLLEKFEEPELYGRVTPKTRRLLPKKTSENLLIAH